MNDKKTIDELEKQIESTGDLINEMYLNGEIAQDQCTKLLNSLGYEYLEN